MSVVLVSGGSRGIGAEIVRQFSTNGSSVYYLYSNKALVTGENIHPVKCDVSDPVQCKNAIESIYKEVDHIDCFVSNSGISLTGLATDFDFSNYHQIMDINFGGLFNLSNLIIPDMVNHKSGSIIAISSMWGQTGASCEALYSATKGAIDAYIKSLAKELGPSNIRVNAVSPGVIDTDMMSSFSEDDKKLLAEETPLERIGTVKDVAKMVYFLSTNDASFVTGQIIGVNGGMLI